MISKLGLQTVNFFCLAVWALDFSFLGGGNPTILTVLKVLSSIEPKRDNDYGNGSYLLPVV